MSLQHTAGRGSLPLAQNGRNSFDQAPHIAQAGVVEVAKVSFLLDDPGVHAKREDGQGGASREKDCSGSEHHDPSLAVNIMPGDGGRHPGGLCLPFFAAAYEPVLTRNMEKAFAPVIDLAQACGYPLAFLMMTGGMLMMILGQRKRGIDMIKWAVLGYLGLQFVPVLMSIIAATAQAMRP